MIDEIRNCVFYDKNGKEIMRFDKLSNISITYSIQASSIPTIDCNFSADFEYDDELNNKYEKCKVMYNGHSSM